MFILSFKSKKLVNRSKKYHVWKHFANFYFESCTVVLIGLLWVKELRSLLFENFFVGFFTFFRGFEVSLNWVAGLVVLWGWSIVLILDRRSISHWHMGLLLISRLQWLVLRGLHIRLIDLLRHLIIILVIHDRLLPRLSLNNLSLVILKLLSLWHH